MAINKQIGAEGEADVALKVKCPNCGKKLVQLPPNYPLYDLQCEACQFRVQVKTSNSKPTGTVLGAGWEILDKVLKAGFLMPPLIVNYKWSQGGNKKQQIRFYPFVPKTHIKTRKLSPQARRANYKMFNYVGLEELPNFLLYEL